MPVAKIKRGTFFAINLPPGRHTIGSDKGVPLSVAVPISGELFVRLSWQMEAGEPPTLVFDKVAAGVARNEMRFVIYIDSKNALSSSVPKTDPRPPPELQFKHRDDQPSQE